MQASGSGSQVFRHLWHISKSALTVVEGIAILALIFGPLRGHTGVRVRQAIEARGCQILFLPAYSPDLSPIEEAFSKLKAFLRRISARTREVLVQAIGAPSPPRTRRAGLALWLLTSHH